MAKHLVVYDFLIISVAFDTRCKRYVIWLIHLCLTLLIFLSVQCYAMHGQNIYLPVCVCVSVCPSNFLSTRLNGFLQLIA